MKKLVKAIIILTVAVIVLFIAGVVLPLLIEYFFKALLFCMQKPTMAIAIIAAFMVGMLFNEFADRADKRINK